MKISLCLNGSDLLRHIYVVDHCISENLKLGVVETLPCSQCVRTTMLKHIVEEYIRNDNSLEKTWDIISNVCNNCCSSSYLIGYLDNDIVLSGVSEIHVRIHHEVGNLLSRISEIGCDFFSDINDIAEQHLDKTHALCEFIDTVVVENYNDVIIKVSLYDNVEF